MDTRPIGVFDSGLGGLTAVRQLRRVLPGEDIVYFGDTGRVPYGSRGRETIIQYARQDIGFLLSKNVKFIVAACGTVSSTYPPAEAAHLPVPFTGVVGPPPAAPPLPPAPGASASSAPRPPSVRAATRRFCASWCRMRSCLPKPARCLCRWWKTATWTTATR